MAALRVGLDIGSRYLKAAAWQEGGAPRFWAWPIEGNPVRCTLQALREVVSQTGEPRFLLGITGENGKVAAQI